MKKFLFLLMATVSMLKVNAQDSTLPMLEEGRIWNKLSLHPAPLDECKYKDIHGRPCAGDPRQYVVRGDTVIEGRTYKRICSEKWYSPVCMRQEGSLVYMYDYEGSKKEALVYDFSLKERDTIAIAGDKDNRLVVDKVDTVKTDGVSRRRLTMNWINNYDNEESEILADIWVEGIGGVVSAPCFFMEWQETEYSPVLSSCEQDGKCIFTEDDFYAPAWKDETVSVKDIMNPSTVIQPSVFYDLQGRRLSGKPVKGVYIKSGKKRLVK